MTISNHMPELIQYLQGGILINFNIKIINNSLDDISQYQYDSVRVELNSSRNEIINSLIEYKYSISNEFALINNYNIGIGIDDYNQYQEYRSACKKIADDVVELIEH